MSVAQTAKRRRRQLALTRPPKGKSAKAKDASAALRARMAQKKK